jgi:hypothetical protein
LLAVPQKINQLNREPIRVCPFNKAVKSSLFSSPFAYFSDTPKPTADQRSPFCPDHRFQRLVQLRGLRGMGGIQPTALFTREHSHADTGIPSLFNKRTA